MVARISASFVDGIGEPIVEGSGLVSVIQNARGHYGYLPGFGRPVKAGEFILGYPNELGRLPAAPSPDVLGRNGTYASFRKLRIDVAGFRRFLGRQRGFTRGAGGSGGQDGRAVAERRSSGTDARSRRCRAAQDPQRVNDFSYNEDPVGLRCPLGAHIRRMNPRRTVWPRPVPTFSCIAFCAEARRTGRRCLTV